MNMQTDCIPTTVAGRNATPLALIEAAKNVFNGPFLDPATDKEINEKVGADHIFALEDDGFTQEWKYPNVWLNPPGRTVVGANLSDVVYWRYQLDRPVIERKICPAMDENGISAPDGIVETWLQYKGKKPKAAKQIEAAEWIRKLYSHWSDGDIETAIGLCYRSTTLSSLSKESLNEAILCIPCSGVASDAVNKSGRLSFETIDENGDREPQKSNPSSSVIICWTNQKQKAFANNFEQFGVIWKPFYSL